MGKDMCPNLVLVLLQPLRIGDDVVDAWVVTTREEEAHVDDDNIVVVLDGRHILANAHLAYPTNRDDLERWARRTRPLGLHIEGKLLAAIAIVDRLIDRHVNDLVRRCARKTSPLRVVVALSTVLVVAGCLLACGRFLASSAWGVATRR